MKPTEAAALLTIAAAFDNRKPDADQAKAWAMALDHLRFEDCREAVVQHYQATRDWMMPSDVIAHVKRIRHKRVVAYGLLPTPPASIDPDDTKAMQAYAIETTRAIADGELTTDNPQLPGGTRGPWEDETTPFEAAADTASRIKYLRTQLAKRAPESECDAIAPTRTFSKPEPVVETEENAS